MSNFLTCRRFLCPVLASSTSSGTALMVSIEMHCTGQARSHWIHPMQSSMLTNSCMRELGGSSQRSSGYCRVTAGPNSFFHVNRMPISGVFTLSQIFTRYCNIPYGPSSWFAVLVAVHVHANTRGVPYIRDLDAAIKFL